MRGKMKRSLMVLLALAIIISLLSVSAMAVAAQSEDTEEVPDYDIWTAQTMLFGYENTGNGLYPTFRNFQEPVYKQLGGCMLDNTPLTALSTTWTVALNEDFRKNPDFIYEAIIISYLKYGNDEAELESELQSNARNFAVGLYGALEEHYEGKWEKLLDSSSKEEAEKMIGSLSGMSEAVSAVSEMVSTGKELISAVSDYLGLQKVKDDRVLLLEKARAACAAMDNPNQNFIDAADKAIRYMNTNIVGYMAEETAEYMYGKYLDSFWEAATVAYPALKGIKLSRQAIELCFNTTSGAESNLKLALLYTADYYFQLGLMSASEAFMDDQTSVKAAQTFMGCFRGYVEFQMYGNSYAKEWVDEFKDQQGILAAAIQQIFYRENLDEAARLSDLCESQTKNRVKLLSIIGKYRKIYEKKYCNAEWMGYLDTTDETVSVTGVQFDEATRTVELDSGGCYAGDATVLPTNATNRTVTYTSSDPEIFSVSSGGFLNPLKEGTATLTATSEDGGYTAEQTIQVVASKRRNVVDSGTCGSNLMWALYKDGTLYISGSGTMPDWRYLSDIPWYSNRSKIRKVKIGNGVTSIGNFAFYECSNLTSVTISDSVTSIGEQAFSNCIKLTSMTLPDSVTSIGGGAFAGCNGLVRIDVEENNKQYCSINGVLFSKDKTEIVCYPSGKTDNTYTIPDSVTNIDEYAFYGCSSLASVTISDSVMGIGDSAFENCSSLTNVMLGKGVTSIGGYAFSRCSKLVSMTIPDSVTSIGEYAFNGCSSLTNVTIPDSVMSIGSDAFNCCYSLESVYITDVAAWCKIQFRSIKANPLWKADNLYLNGALVTDVLIPEGVTKISDYLLSCNSLTSVTIPDSVTSIGSYAFEDSSLSNVTIPDSVTSIGHGAFSGCSSLKSVYITDVAAWCKIDFINNGFGNSTANPLFYADNLYLNGALVTDVVIPDGVTKISDYLFSCNSLTSVMIPDSVTSIGYGAFSDCSSLKNVYIADADAWCKMNFKSSTANPLVYANNLYLNGTLVTDVVIPDGVTKISAYLFSCNSLTSVTIPNSVTSIDSHAFYYCSSLTSVTIPNGVKDIEDYTFFGCSSLSSVTIPDSVTYIDDEAFSSCSSLTNVTIPDSVRHIGSNAFGGCSSLTSVTIGNGVTRIEKGAFIDCWNLSDVYISDIGAWCKIQFANSESSPFWHATNLYLNGVLVTDIVIPDGVTCIGNTALSCDNLKSVTIPDSVTKISDYAFWYCRNLSDVYYEGSESGWQKVSIGSNNDKLTNATIHYNSTGPTDPTDPTDPTEKVISNCTINLEKTSYTYDGKAKQPTVTVKDGSTTLTSGKDYEVTYADNTDAGTAKVTITGKGDYTGSVTKEFTIQKANQTLSASISPSNIQVGKTAQITASAKTDVSYSSSDTKVAAVSASGVVTAKAVGTATITVTAKASKNYNEASKNVTVTVTEKSVPVTKKLSACKVTLAATSYTYDGKEKKPAVTVKDGSNTLTNGKDYEVAYANNINAGTARVTITGKGNYTGTVTMNVVIKKAASVITASNITKATSAKAQKASIGAKVKGGAKLTYKSNNKYVAVDKKGQVTIAKKFVGQATITITAAATKNYNAGTKKVTVTVNPASTKLSSVKNSASKSMKVAWKKNAAVTGYQVQYATAKNFKGAKAVTVKKAATTSTTIKKLTKGKKYYVRVRTYQKVSGKTYYSAWSASKNVTIKK